MRYQSTGVVSVLLSIAPGTFVLDAGNADSNEASAPAEFTQAELKTGYVVFEHHPMERLEESHTPTREAIVSEFSCALAQGEYESVQIGVHALAEDLKNIRIDVESDLEVATYHRINPSAKQELAKDEMTWLSGVPGEIYLQRGEVVEELPQGHSVNFWLTFRAGSDTPAGLYTGKVRIEPAGRPATVVELRLQVRPFRLQPPRIAFGMYYREDMLPSRFGNFSLSDTAARAIYRDMAAHGQNSVTFYMAGDFSQLPPVNSYLQKSVGLAQQEGLVGPDAPCMMLQGNITAINDEQREAATAWLAAQHSEQGWPEIIEYGWDEPPYPAPGLRETYAPLRGVPLRLGTAINGPAAYAYGDLHDVWIVMGGEITPAMQAEAAHLGAQVWTYSYRILREEYLPLRQRYFAGLYTWTHRLGGNFVWAYSHVRHGHAWWMPGTEEPLPITGWEGRREGVDDYCYLQMVEDSASQAEGDPVAVEAAAWLAALRARLAHVDPHEVEAGKPLSLAEYDEIRSRAAGYIEQLGTPSQERIARPPVTHLVDQAAAFRGQSLQACIAGLDDADVSRRRGAALALFEMGQQAVPATGALIRALDDPDLRIPVLRTLDAIGDQAYEAVPQVTALLSHADEFVRLSATFALVGMAQPPTWEDEVKGCVRDDAAQYGQVLVGPLRQALRNSSREIRMAAAFGLFCCGKIAEPALPEAIELIRSDNSTDREAGLRILSGLGPAAVGAMERLVELYIEGEGEDRLVARTIATIGPGAAAAVPVLEQYRTRENGYLADTCYALFCIRGDASDLETLVGLVGDKSRPRGYAEWQDAVRFLAALGGTAAPVADLVRDRIQLLDSESSLQRDIEAALERAEAGGVPLRLMPR